MAAAAMAALTASQGPGLELVQPGGREAAGSPDAPDLPADGNSPYHTELPPLIKPDKPGSSSDLPDVAGPTESGIPATVLAAYKRAERTLGEERPGCNLPWQLLAAIGKVESGQARGGAVDAQGTTHKPILGPALNGVGFAHISDTDGGAYDGDTRYDRAVGPMQFIPSTWANWGADGNGDGREDPNNIYDAALAAGRYLCASGRNLSDPADLERAVLSYNQSREYLRTVLSWLDFYRKGAHEVPDGEGTLPDSPGAGNESRPVRPGGEKAGDGKGGDGGEDGRDGEGGKPSPKPPVSGGGTITPVPPADSEDPDEPGEEPEDPDEPGEEPEDPDEPGEEPEDPDEPGEEPEDPDEPGEEPEDPDEPGEEPEDPDEPGEEPEDPDEPGEEPEDPDEPGCPAEPEDPENPEEPGVGTEEPAGSPSPTPAGEPGGDSEDSENPESSENPEEPGEDPEDPCGDEDPENPDEPGEGEDGSGQQDDERQTPAPTAGATVQARQED
ncbi:lytic murein transglycosylase [Streptomyces sp. HK10]|uniref:lytic transglycosylase domain-containing protein n=1 Tax=Streptomyces sp. HK10 TaxID=3373255 RepID=UPI003748EB14